jgi:hypothetical protein
MGVFGPGPSIIDAGVAAAEGIDRIREYVERDNPDTLTDQELQQWADDNGFKYRKEDGVTYLTPQTEEDEQALDQSSYDSSEGFPIERRMLEPGPDTPALESDNNVSSKSNGSKNEGGDTQMEQSEKYDVLQAGALEYDRSLEDEGHLDGDVSRDYDIEDSDDLVAIGAAMLYEESLNGDDPVDMESLGDYLIENDLGDDFVEYKADLVDQGLIDQVASDVTGAISDSEEIKKDLKRELMFSEAYGQEVQNERDELLDAIDRIDQEAADIDLDTSRLESAIQTRNDIVNSEQDAETTRQSLRDRRSEYN